MAKDLKTLKNKVADTQKQIKKLQNQLTKDSEKLFKASCQEIFNNHEDFSSFAWTQFTVHWNDGDPCEFSVYNDSIYIDNEDDAEDVYSLNLFYEELKVKDKSIAKLEKEAQQLEKDGSNDWRIKHNRERIKDLQAGDLEKTERRYKFVKEISDLLKSIDEDSFERMFGDHAKVVVTRDGIDVESYEHD
jgi:hypothetical protein